MYGLLLQLLLNLIIIFSWIFKSDSFSALNIPPIWVWGAIGIFLSFVSRLFKKTKLSFFIISSWVLTVIALADETKSLSRGFKPTLKQSIKKTHNHIRVISVNCNGRNLNIVREAMEFNPDIIFIQESPSPNELLYLLEKENYNSYRTIGGWDCAIIAKGVLTKRKYPSILFNHSAGASIRLDTGAEIELLSLHLERAITRWDLWNPECWTEHNKRNQDRKNQLTHLLSELQTHSGNMPILFGGDFNSSYQSNLYRIIPDNFTNTFDEKGKGIGNTFTNYFPIIRIDHIYSSEHFAVKDSRSAKTQNSDHRMVISDLMLESSD